MYIVMKRIEKSAIWRRVMRGVAKGSLLALLLLFPFVAQGKWGEKVPNRQYADFKRWHLGFSVGCHIQDLTFYHNGFVTPDNQQWQMEVPSFSPGFCVNVLLDLRLHRYFNLRLSPGMYFGSKTVEMRDYNGFGERRVQDVKSSYVVVHSTSRSRATVCATYVHTPPSGRWPLST